MLIPYLAQTFSRTDFHRCYCILGCGVRPGCILQSRGFLQLIPNLQGLLFWVFLSFSCRGAAPDCPLHAEGKWSNQKLLLRPSNTAKCATKEMLRKGLSAQVTDDGRALVMQNTKQPYSKESVGSNTRLVWHLRAAIVRAPKCFRAMWQKPSNRQIRSELP